MPIRIWGFPQSPCRVDAAAGVDGSRGSGAGACAESGAAV